MKLLLGLLACLFALAAPASADPFYFGGYEDGYMEFDRRFFDLWLPIEQVMEGEDGAERPLRGEVYVWAKRLRSPVPSEEDGTGYYNFGPAKLRLTTDHGVFKARVPQLSFELENYGDLDEYDDRDVWSPDFRLLNPRFDLELATYLGVRKRAADSWWWFYADGFQRGDVSLLASDDAYMAARLYQFNPMFLQVQGIPRLEEMAAMARVAGDAAVPGPSMLLLSAVGAVGLLGQHRRRRR